MAAMERLTRQGLQEFLARETLFGGAPPGALDEIAGLASQDLVKEGVTVFVAGQRCTALHFVASGCGQIVVGSPDGRQRVLHRAFAGEMVGGVPFFDGKPYPASFVAETDCLLVRFPRERLLDLLSRRPMVTLSIVGALARRLRKMVSLVDAMSFADTQHRLWDYLVSSSEPVGAGEYPRVLDPLPTREHIASVIGTVREVVSRRLSSLVETGHVRIEGRRATILRPLD